MKRSWNPFVWGGFAVTVMAILSYFFFFLRFPVTRDVPWATFLLFVVATGLLWTGVSRAFLQPQRYRGKISGLVLTAVSGVLITLFCYMTFALGKDLPPSAGAPRAGQQAPDFTLSDPGGKPVTLSEILRSNRAAVLIFYRGYW
jgi:hypothetical protein